MDTANQNVQTGLYADVSQDNGPETSTKNPRAQEPVSAVPVFNVFPATGDFDSGYAHWGLND